MLIVIEGADLNFKSTVANKLADKLGWEVVKGSSFEQSKCTDEELFQDFLDKILGKENLILDRYQYSNLAYSPLYDGYAMVSEKDKVFIETMMKIGNVKLIYLYADTDTLVGRMRKRGDKDVTEDRLEAINSRFNEVMENTNYKFLSIDTSKYNSDEIVEKVLNYI